MRATFADPTNCCLCNHPIRSKECLHPWRKAFSEWPDFLLAEVHKAAPNTWEELAHE